MTLASLRPRGRRSPRSGPVDRSTQQREQAAACRSAEEVENHSQNRKRRPDLEAQKGHRDQLEVLYAEKDGGGHEHADDSQMNPAHAASSCRWKTNPAAAGYLNGPFQAETGADPTCSRDDEIDAEENPQNVQTGDRPMRQDHEADEEGNQPRQR